MKKLYIYICTSIFALSMVGCQDWMNVDPAGVQTYTTYWKTKGEVEGVLSTAYRNLRTAVTDGTIINWGEVRASDLGLNGQSDLNNVRTGNILPTSGMTSWSSIYNIIGMANSVIKYAPSVVEKDASFNEYEMRSIVAEAYFLRALSYFYLVRTFENVPYVTEPYVTDDAEFLVTQSSGDSILACEIDCMSPYIGSAKVMFPDTIYNKGRATRWALLTLRADMELWLASKDESYYQKCIDDCDSVINSGFIALVGQTTYIPTTTPEGKDTVKEVSSNQSWFYNFSPGNSNESIFEAQFNNLSGQTNSFYSWFSAQDNSSMPTSQRYYTTDRFIARMSGIIDPQDVRSRLSWGVTNQGGTPIPSTNVGKYFYEDEVGNKRVSTNTQNWIFYRLAEVYLMKAEALAMQGHRTEAIRTLNIVRTRAGSPALSENSSDYNTEIGVLNAIMNERGIEFYAEGKRWFDLLRVGLRHDAANKDWLISKCTEDLNAIDKALVSSKMNKNAPHSWYLPVNSDELGRNPALVQNPAYAAYGK